MKMVRQNIEPIILKSFLQISNNNFPVVPSVLKESRKNKLLHQSK